MAYKNPGRACNIALGHVKDSIERLKRLQSYLEQAKWQGSLTT